MDTLLKHEISELEKMTVTELREKYWELFREVTPSHNKQQLLKRIAWRIETKRGGIWQVSTVRRMLANRFYTGWAVFEQGYVRGQHKAIVPDGLFSRCQLYSRVKNP